MAVELLKLTDGDTTENIKRIAENTRRILTPWVVAAKQFELGEREFLEFLRITLDTGYLLLNRSHVFTENRANRASKLELLTVGFEIARNMATKPEKPGAKAKPTRKQKLIIENALLTQKGACNSTRYVLSYRENFAEFAGYLSEAARDFEIPDADTIFRATFRRRVAALRKERNLVRKAP